jgi:hypothetical protein
MKKFNLLLLLLSFVNFGTIAQVGIGTTTPNASSLLDVSSVDKGLLIPRIALVQTTNFSPLLAHVAGMLVYNTATASDVSPGQYYNNGTKWIRVADASISNTNYSFLRTSDNLPTQTIGDNTVSAYRFGNTGFSTTIPKAPIQVGLENNAVTTGTGMLEVNLNDSDPKIQGLIVSNKRTTGANFAVNATTFGTGASQNIALYAFADNGIKNYGLFVQAGNSFMGDNTKISTLSSTITPNAILEVEATNKGILIPRLTTAQRIAIASPTQSLMVYDTDVDLFYFYSTTNASWTAINAGSVKSITATNYTLLPNDSGRIIEFTSATTVTLTVPSGLPTGFQVSITQAGTGIVTFVVSGGMVLNSRLSATTTAGQWSKAVIEVRANNSSVLSGDIQ